MPPTQFAQTSTTSLLVSGKFTGEKRSAVNQRTDAKWYSRTEILSVLGHEAVEAGKDQPSKVRAPNLDHFQAADEGSKATADVPVEEAPFTLPPATTLAGVMIRNWADEKIVFGK